jgi:phospholipid/cholesterol/gamma-HCH transport system permease protein
MADTSDISTADISHGLPGGLSFESSDGDALIVRISGRWSLGADRPPIAKLQERLESGTPLRQVAFDAKELKEWDTGLLIFLRRIVDVCAARSIDLQTDGLPEGAQRLLKLAAAVPGEDRTDSTLKRPSVREQIGVEVIAAFTSGVDMVNFIGEATIAMGKLLVGKARFRKRDLFLIIQQCGAQALPIVTLISFLIGLILAFVGAVQLKMFGAEIFVADLVGIAMVREFAAVMTGIIMAGRTGAAFAAELGTMTVNEEIDAFKTLGFSPMEFLVLPRMIALALMMPLLALYANLVGILGGMIVGVGMLGITITQYWTQTQAAVGLPDLFVGLGKSAVFGVLVALAGCLRGIQCGRSSAAVGIAATSAVVTAIVAIILVDAAFAVITNIVGL